MKRYMIDIETLATCPDAAITAIGVCRFTYDGEVTDTLDLLVDAADAQRHGAVVDANTVYWWLQQSDHARNALVVEGKLSEADALNRLNVFLSGADEIWSHATFDFVVVTSAMRRHGIKPLFSYRAARDIRTLMALAPKGSQPVERKGVHHNALDDAKFQVAYCTTALKALRGTPQ